MSLPPIQTLTVHFKSGRTITTEVDFSDPLTHMYWSGDVRLKENVQWGKYLIMISEIEYVERIAP